MSWWSPLTACRRRACARARPPRPSMWRSGGGSTAVLLACVTLLHSPQSPAQPACDPPAGRLVSSEGQVEVRRAVGSGWQGISLGEPLCQGDSVRAGRLSRAAVALANEAVLRIDQNTTLQLVQIAEAEDGRSVIDLIKGLFQSFSRKPRLINVSSPFLNGTIEGTEFVVRAGDDQGSLAVLEGQVRVETPDGSVAVAAGQQAIAAPGQPPQIRMLVDPTDAVQWSLYYPPVLSVSQAKHAERSDDSVGETIDSLEDIPVEQRDAEFHLRRAALLLQVGRVNEARVEISAALSQQPGLGRAYALRSVIEVVQNQREQALADGLKAVELGREAGSSIALSYAQQAFFQIPEARDTLLAATAEHPDDALLWARLAEVQLMLGDERSAAEAAEAAERASTADSQLSRVNLVRGFAALAEFRNEEARQHFENAVALSSADPLAHLGLGLSEISAGNLARGRQELEIAVALDSQSALLRSYLGKAYFEEKRSPLDAEQFGIAKVLDPLDPTPYLYDGIRRQTENDPIGALRDLQESIARNDNRAVYRGRLLLDKDRAARGTSLARVYNDLGFTQAGINEATRSLAVDSSNTSAHRFLSDVYRNQRRSEVARVSELLQAQLLQDNNLNPVQPSISSTNLNIVTLGGPASVGFNEFTPLFQRNQTQVNASALAGHNSTVGGEAVASGVYDRFSFSAGAFGYETDGFRPNNDLSHEIYDVYVQAALSPEFNVQAEFTHRKSDRGDLAMNFDPDDFDPTFRRSLEEDSYRLGARFTPSLRSTVLLSAIHTEREIDGDQKQEVFFIPGLGPINLVEDLRSEDDADQYEGQYLYQAERFDVIAGVARATVDKKDSIDVSFETPFGPDSGDPPFTVDDDVRDTRGYVYGQFTIPSDLIWTVGVSHQRYEDDSFDFEESSPKLGLRWALGDSVSLRAAYFETIKPVLANNRMLEPSQISGFKQYFDDADATKSKGYGLALDWRAGRSVYLGAEASKRELDSPVIDPISGDGVFEDREEYMHRLYSYWTLGDRWVLSAEFLYDKFENQKGSMVGDLVPSNVRTVSLPLGVSYFHPSGFFAGLAVAFVDQEVDGQEDYRFGTGDSSFSVTDLAVGVRLPKRAGVLSLSVQNIFDEDFDYLDDSYRSFETEPVTGPYIPDRALTARVTLNF